MAEVTDGARAAAVIAPRALGLADGRVVVVRTATTADLAGIIDFFERLSPGSQPHMRRAMIERIVASGGDRMSVLAQPAEFRATTRHVVGVGGWVYLPSEDRCDLSIAVADAWQNVLLGTGMVLVLLEAAVACGHARFLAEVLSTNARMLGLLASLGASLRTRHDGGVARVEFALPCRAVRPGVQDLRAPVPPSAGAGVP